MVYANSKQKEKIIKKIRVKKKTQEYDGGTELIMEYADACYLCGEGDDEAGLLVCDHCDYRVCHFECLGLSSVPES